MQRINEFYVDDQKDFQTVHSWTTEKQLYGRVQQDNHRPVILYVKGHALSDAAVGF